MGWCNDPPPMVLPEQAARERIDTALVAAGWGWAVQDSRT